MNMRIMGFLIFCCIILVGCQNEESATLEEEEQPNERFLRVENPSENEQGQKTNTEIAQHLADVASSVPEVNNASALVAGPYTVVAIDVKEDIDRSRVGSIKYSVSEALYHDPFGKTAVVVADADLTARLQGMGERIQQGYPVQGVVEELAAIVARAIPEFPARDDQPQEPDGNKQMLDEEEERQLEDIQDEQSNQQR